MKAMLIALAVATHGLALILGMRAGLNDGIALASIDADSDRIAAVACGPRAWVAKRGSDRLCVYINHDESAVIRTVNRPVGEL